MHGQALATLKSRLCGSCPAVVTLAIACHLASAFVLFRVVAGVIAIALAWSTVAGHAYRIARANPVLALRYE